MKKVLFGGSFNPPTIAHYEIIKYLAQSNKFDEVFILPNGDSYKFAGKELNNFHHRMNMLKLICREFDNVKILELENQGEFKGTYETLEKLNHPYFVLGDDCLEKLHLWKNFEQLLNDNHFILINRGHHKDLKQILLANEHLRKYIDHFEIININTSNVSSSEFRKSHHQHVVTKEVLDYIKTNHLYDFEG